MGAFCVSGDGILFGEKNHIYLNGQDDQLFLCKTSVEGIQIKQNLLNRVRRVFNYGEVLLLCGQEELGSGSPDWPPQAGLGDPFSHHLFFSLVMRIVVELQPINRRLNIPLFSNS